MFNNALCAHDDDDDDDASVIIIYGKQVKHIHSLTHSLTIIVLFCIVIVS